MSIFDARDATLDGFEFPFLPINKDLNIFEASGQGVFADGVNGFVNGEETFTFYHDYQWIYIVTILAGFFTAYGIGANDVANAFATSVGSKALTVGQAVVIAAIFEFSGAFFLGTSVTDTVRKGIVKVTLFQGHEDWLMIGMCCSVMVVGVWLLVATTFELPVSTTHSMVGAIIGFSLCCPGGVENVQWDKVQQIVISWFASPALSGAIAAAIFLGVRTTILRSDNSFNRTMIFFPLLVFFTVMINVFFILKKGGKNFKADKWPIEQSIGVGAITGAVVGLAVFLLLIPVIRKRLEGISEDDELSADITSDDGKKDEEIGGRRLSIENVALGRVARFREGTNVHRAITENETVGNIHDNAEVFGTRTEKAFGYLQVFTAIFDSFSHGANDVANSIGPVASVWSVFNVGVGVADAKKVEFPTWILAVGGAGIVVGLATYGYKIMSAIGVKLVKVTPTRGFSIELGAAFVIVAGSYLALPLSTTHCQVGATIGVGLCENNWREAVNFKLLAKVFAGWVFTLVVAGSGCAMLFSFVVYSPSINPPVSNTNCLIYQGVHLKSTAASASITLPFMADPGADFDGAEPVERTLTIIAGYNVDLAQQQPERLVKKKEQNDVAQGYVLKSSDLDDLLVNNRTGLEAIWNGARERYFELEEVNATAVTVGGAF